MIIPTAEPFFFPGTKTGCLLIHGFTGSPKEMRWMGEYLAQNGNAVLGIRLAGHATQPEDMMRMHWRDWLASVEDGYHLLRNLVDQVFLVGLSMGGILSYIFASQFPVSGIITMSTPYALPSDPRLPFVKIFSPILPCIPKGPADRHDLEASKSHVEYPCIPLKSVIQLRSMLSEMQVCLSRISVPALIIHSRQDKGIGLDNAEKIYSSIKSTDKTLVIVENSGHDVPREPDREFVFKTTGDFIQRVANSA